MRKECQNRGAGTHLIGAVEEEARVRGNVLLHLAVDPQHNKGAYRLYERLGFRPMSSEKYRSTWSYTDDNGDVQVVVEWLIDMVKELS